MSLRKFTVKIQQIVENRLHLLAFESKLASTYCQAKLNSSQLKDLLVAGYLIDSVDDDDFLQSAQHCGTTVNVCLYTFLKSVGEAMLTARIQLGKDRASFFSIYLWDLCLRHQFRWKCLIWNWGLNLSCLSNRALTIFVLQFLLVLTIFNNFKSNISEQN